MKRTTMTTVLLGLFTWACCLAAQAPSADMAMKIVQARKDNAALMQQYTWDCRTELMKDGNVLDVRIDQVQCGPDGQLQRSVLNNDPSRHPHGFLRKRIAENKQKELEQYLAGLRKLLDQYTLPTAGKVLDFMTSANVQFVKAPDGTALLMMTGSGVVVPGDSLSIWADAATHKMRKVEITTTYEDGAASVTATYKTLGSGLTFMALAEVVLSDKGLSLQVHNYDYQQND